MIFYSYCCSVSGCGSSGSCLFYFRHLCIWKFQRWQWRRKNFNQIFNRRFYGRECTKLIVSSKKRETKNREHLLLITDHSSCIVVHFAAKVGSLKIVLNLQTETLDHCSKTHDQMTVIQIASESGHYNLFKSLWKKKTLTNIWKRSRLKVK